MKVWILVAQYLDAEGAAKLACAVGLPAAALGCRNPNSSRSRLAGWLSLWGAQSLGETVNTRIARGNSAATTYMESQCNRPVFVAHDISPKSSQHTFPPFGPELAHDTGLTGQIFRDVTRTMPGSGWFESAARDDDCATRITEQPAVSGVHGLYILLQVVAQHVAEPVVSYCQGMNFVAAACLVAAAQADADLYAPTQRSWCTLRHLKLATRAMACILYRCGFSQVWESSMRRIVVCSHMLLSQLRVSQPAVHSWCTHRREGLTAEMIGVGLLVPCMVSSLPLTTALSALDLLALAGWSGLMAAAEHTLVVAFNAASGTAAPGTAATSRRSLSDIMREMRQIRRGQESSINPAFSVLFQDDIFFAGALRRLRCPAVWQQTEATVQAEFTVAHVCAHSSRQENTGSTPALPESVMDNVRALLPDSIREAAAAVVPLPALPAQPPKPAGHPTNAPPELDTTLLAPAAQQVHSPSRKALHGRAARLDAQFTLDSCPLMPPFQALRVPCAAWDTYKSVLRPMRRVSLCSLPHHAGLRDRLRGTWQRASTTAPAKAAAAAGGSGGTLKPPLEEKWSFHSHCEFRYISARDISASPPQWSSAGGTLDRVVHCLAQYAQDTHSLQRRAAAMQNIVQGASAACASAERTSRSAAARAAQLGRQTQALRQRLQDLTMGQADKPAPSQASVQMGASAVRELGQELAAAHAQHKAACSHASAAAAAAGDAAAAKQETVEVAQQLLNTLQQLHSQLWIDIARLWRQHWEG